jgi:GTP cyclohydrolase I
VSLLNAQMLPDVQASVDPRGVALDEVGVCGLVLPVHVAAPDGSTQPTVAEFDVSVGLAAETRGTHMSRFVEEATALSALTPAVVVAFADSLRVRLDAPSSQVLVRFPLFVPRAAPVSGLTAPHRYDAWLGATSTGVGDTKQVVVTVGVRAAVTSLCPCSREISDYGAHSQRGYVDLEVECPEWRHGAGVWAQELFAYADEAGSAQIHPLLKRSDERAVTMEAYDHPAFVEDIARDVVVAVRADPRCAAWSVTVTNHESIHDHQAVARVRGQR